MDKPWFKRWFGEAYKQLYPHRDYREAGAQAGFVLRALPVTPEWRILDIGCGQGRHLEIMRGLGHSHCMGLDLSLPLLRDARAAGLGVARGDMRHLPFRPGGFDLVTSFFTSFGYFATFEEDVEALSQFVSMLKPGGYLFLDLINKEHLLARLVPQDSRHVAGSEVVQRRRVEHPDSGTGKVVVVKEIEIRKADGDVERFEERVRLYGMDDIRSLMEKFSLTHLETYGDEAGAPYHPGNSPRMAMLMQKRMPPPSLSLKQAQQQQQQQQQSRMPLSGSQAV
jgi:SAM-dependent methyltransferase